MTVAFRTITDRVRHEIDKIKGSRHIATAAPVTTAAAAEELVAEVRAELHAATHHAFAWRTGRGREAFRYSDDGEPSGSAGRPILRQIDGRHLTDLCVVVTRYFGGTRLGVGGLVRAYGGAAAAVLDLAEIRTVVVTERIVVTHGYEQSGAVRGILTARALEPIEARYDAEVRLVFDVPQDEVDEFVRAIRDGTANRARIDRPAPG